MKFKLSVIVIHLGKDKLLIDFLDSLYNISKIYFSFEVIVIDNFSQSSEIERITSAYENCRVVSLNSKVGYAAATNVGINLSDSEYILWCNNDLIFSLNSINKLIEFMEKNISCAICGPQLLNQDKTLQESGSYLDINLLSLIAEKLHLLNALESTIRIIYNIFNKNLVLKVTTGACCLIRRSYLAELGSFIDDRYYMYCEEFDLSYMFRKLGYTISIEPQSEIVHLGGQTTSKTSINFLLQSYKSKYAYLFKHYGNLTVFIFSLFVVLSSIINIFINLCLMIFWMIFNFNKIYTLKLIILFNWHLIKLSLSSEKLNSQNLVYYYEY